MIANTKSKAKISPRANSIIAAGYALAAVGLMGVITINGASGIPPLVQAGVAALITLGVLLSITGIMMKRSEFDRNQAQVRNGLFMHGSSLFILLLGIGITQIFNSPSGFLSSIVFLVVSSILALAGIITLRKKYISSGTSDHKQISYLLLGTILIIAGVGLIIVSNIESYYTISQLDNTIYNDIGATISAYGFVISAYSFLTFPRRFPGMFDQQLK